MARTVGDPLRMAGTGMSLARLGQIAGPKNESRQFLAEFAPQERNACVLATKAYTAS